MSILAVDFGSVHTRAVLIDRVSGHFELVGFARTRTTDTFPAQNVKIGLDRVLAQLTDVTSRTFYSPEGTIISPEEPDRSGVDTFVITSSGGRPLRAIVVGLMPDMSVQAAFSVLSNTYVDIVETISLQDGRTPADRLNAVLKSYPNVIFITGGVDGGAVNSVLGLAQSVKLAVSVMDKRRRPTVIYAGNAVLGAAVKALFTGTAEVLVAPNVRPTPEKLEVGPARALLAEAFDNFTQTRDMGFAELAALPQNGVQPTASGYAAIASYLAKSRNEKVIVLDVGSAASILAVATPKTADFLIRTDLGVGHNAPNLLDAAGVSAIRRWLPFHAENDDLLTFALNKSVRPGVVPFSLREVYLEHALLKAATATLAQGANLGAAPAADSVIVGGASINDTGHPGYSSLLAIDALGLTGVVKIWGDPFGLTSALGAVADTRGDAVTQVLDGTGYTLLSTAICASGKARLDKPAIRVIVDSEYTGKHTVVVNGGHLAVIPLPLGTKATVRVRVLTRGLDINGRRGLKLKLTGSGAGIIIDARGRALPLDLPLAQKATLLPQWVSEVTGDEVRVFSEPTIGLRGKSPDEEKLEDTEALSPARQRQQRREQRRGRQKDDSSAIPEPTIEDLRNALS